MRHRVDGGRGVTYPTPLHRADREQRTRWLTDAAIAYANRLARQETR